jgi:hypothetical protein
MLFYENDNDDDDDDDDDGDKIIWLLKWYIRELHDNGWKSVRYNSYQKQNLCVSAPKFCSRILKGETITKIKSD